MAGIKISELPEASNVVGNELIAIVQDSCTKFVAASAIGATGDSTICSVIAGCGLQGGGSYGAVSLCLDANCMGKYNGVSTTVRSSSACWDTSYTTVQSQSSFWESAYSSSTSLASCPGLNCVGDIEGLCVGLGIIGGGSSGTVCICIDTATVVIKSGNQTIGGTKHFTASQTNFNSVSGTGYIMTGSGTHCISISDTDVAIIGGNSNTIAGTACCSAIIAGANNTVCNMLGVAVGGQLNCVVADYSSTIGGATNKVCGSGALSVVIGGCTNIVKHNSSVIAGGTDMTSVSGCMLHTESLYLDNLPTSDPGVAGVVWNDSGTLKIST